MISCEDTSDEESDSHIESEVQKYVDSDKADSDIEIELYSQIHFAEDINATTSAQSIGNDSSYIFNVSPVKSLDSLFFKSNTELSCDVKQGTSEIMKLNHFESSTPKTSVKNNLVVGKKIIECKVGNKVKLPKAKTGKIALKPSKSSEDSGCFESATCSDDRDGEDTDESVVILEPPDVLTNVNKEVILIDSSPTSNDVSSGRNSASPKQFESDDSSKNLFTASSSRADTSGNKVKPSKAKKGNTALKLSKSSKFVTCLEDSNDDTDSDESSIILDLPVCDAITNVESSEEIFVDNRRTYNDVSSRRNSTCPELSDSDDSLKFSFSTPSLVTNTSGDLWHIDHEDRFSFIKKQKRYHEKHSSICNNCKKKGHLSKDCMEPRNTKCYICGRDHVFSMCHQRMCGRCLEYGHSTKRCRYKASELQCDLCKMRGHTIQDCPDLWRRYHLTTSSDYIVKGTKEVSQGVKKYCYNCGREGHYGHECLRPRMSPDSYPTWPFIISYKDPSRQLLKKHFKKSFVGKSSNSSRHYDSHSRRKHKKHRSRADELRTLISEKHPENSKKSRSKEKDKKSYDGKYIRGDDFPRSSSIIVLDDEGPKDKKKRKRDIDKLFAFKRKKQKLNTTV